MVTISRNIPTRVNDAGESPISILIGVVVFVMILLGLGPAIVAFTTLTAANGHLRRVSKELSAVVDDARRAPWDTLDPTAAPVTRNMMLDDVSVPVTSWVEPKDGDPRTRILTYTAPMPTSGANCTNPQALELKCVVRSAIVTASPDDTLPASSAGVTLTDPALAGGTPVPVTGDAVVATLAPVSAQTRVYVTGYTAGSPSSSSFTTLGLYTSGIPRTHVDVTADGTGWLFASAVLCPVWKGQAGTGSQVVLTAAGGGQLSHVVVRLAPDTTANRC